MGIFEPTKLHPYREIIFNQFICQKTTHLLNLTLVVTFLVSTSLRGANFECSDFRTKNDNPIYGGHMNIIEFLN